MKPFVEETVRIKDLGYMQFHEPLDRKLQVERDMDDYHQVPKDPSYDASQTRCRVTWVM